MGSKDLMSSLGKDCHVQDTVQILSQRGVPSVKDVFKPTAPADKSCACACRSDSALLHYLFLFYESMSWNC